MSGGRSGEELRLNRKTQRFVVTDWIGMLQKKTQKEECESLFSTVNDFMPTLLHSQRVLQVAFYLMHTLFLTYY